jgi:streptogramin lyase
VGGFQNGAALTAQFNNPLGVCADAAGNIYVADVGNARIRKIDVGNNVTTYAGSGTRGFQNGVAASTQFDFPSGVCADAAGNIYVADAANHRIRKIDVGGNVTTYAGSGTRGLQNGVAASAQFNFPSSVCADAVGNIYVADRENQCIRKIDVGGNVTTYAGSSTQGFQNGAAASAQFNSPRGVCADAVGNIYVADQDNQCIRKIAPALTGITFFSPTSGGEGTTIVYPNPIESELRVRGAVPRSVRVYDMRGAVVLEECTQSDVVNVNSLPSGAYMIVVETAEGSGRIMCQRVVKR